jgi:hypothetical protein
MRGLRVVESQDELRFGQGDGFEEDSREADEFSGSFAVNAAVGNGGEEASERLIEGSCGNEIAGKWLGDMASCTVCFAEAAEFTFVVETVSGITKRARHAATAAIGVRKVTQRRAVFGESLGHRYSPERKLSCKRKRPRRKSRGRSFLRGEV